MTANIEMISKNRVRHRTTVRTIYGIPEVRPPLVCFSLNHCTAATPKLAHERELQSPNEEDDGQRTLVDINAGKWATVESVPKELKKKVFCTDASTAYGYEGDG